MSQPHLTYTYTKRRHMSFHRKLFTLWTLFTFSDPIHCFCFLTDLNFQTDFCSCIKPWKIANDPISLEIPLYKCIWIHKLPNSRKSKIVLVSWFHFILFFNPPPQIKTNQKKPTCNHMYFVRISNYRTKCRTVSVIKKRGWK